MKTDRSSESFFLQETFPYSKLANSKRKKLSLPQVSGVSQSFTASKTCNRGTETSLNVSQIYMRATIAPESRATEEKRKQMLKEFVLTSPIVDYYKTPETIQSHDNVRDRALEIASRIFKLYQVSFRLVKGFNNPSYASALKIEPLSDDDETLFRFLVEFIPEFASIPTSLIQKLGIKSFNLCMNYEYKYTRFLSILKKKKLENVIERTFAIRKMNCKEDVRNALYKPLMHYFLSHNEDFANKWHEVIESTPVETSQFKKLIISHKELTELIDTFKLVMDIIRKKKVELTSEQKSKVEILERALADFDPEGMGVLLLESKKLCNFSKTYL